MLNTCGRENKRKQRAKKVVSDSPRLVDFTIGLVNSVLNLPAWQVKFFSGILIAIELLSTLAIIGLVKMTFGLVNANYSFPEWQAVKLTFFAP